MLSEIQLDELQDLHGHVGLIHRGAGEGQMPPVPGLTVNDRKEDIRYIQKPPSAVLHDYFVALSAED